MPKIITWLIFWGFWGCYILLQAQFSYQISTGSGGNPQGINIEADNANSGWAAITTAPQTSNLWSANQTLPFTFQLYGQSVSQFKVSQNGLITFSTATAQLPNANATIPTTSLPPLTIVCYWDEFTADGSTGTNDIVYTKTFGTSPNRQFWIKWFSFEYGNPVVPFAYFSCVLNESDNVVYIVDHHLVNGTTTASMGIQLNATTGVSYGNDSLNFQSGSSLHSDNSWVSFSPTVSNQPDLNVTALISPLSHCELTNQEQVAVRVSNLGSLPIYGFQLSYQFDGQPVVGQSYPDTILPANTQVISFTTTINASLSGKYPIIIWGKAAGDAISNNDTLSTAILNYGSINAYPQAQSYENILLVSDSLRVSSGSNAAVGVSSWAALGGLQGIVLDGGNGTSWVNPSPSNIWTINPSYISTVYQCINTQNINTLWLKFNLKQQYQYQSDYTNFRITIDGQPISQTIQPTSGSINWVSYDIDLTPFLTHSIQEIGFESVCKYTLNHGGGGVGNANLLDEVLFWQPIVTQLPADTAVCRGNFLTLDTGLPGIQTFWNNGLSGSSITVLLSQDTKLIAALVDSITGFTTYDTVDVRIYDKPFAVLPLNPIACGSLELNALNNGNFYLWNTGETTQSITVTQTGVYQVHIWNDAADCDITDSSFVTVNPAILVDLGHDTMFCDFFPSPILLDAANSGAIFTWNTGDFTQTIQAITPGWYWVEVYNNGCKARDSILLSYAITPQAGIAGPTTGTVGAPPLSFTDNSTGSVNQWYWDFGTDAVPAQAQGPGPFDVLYQTTGTKTVVLIVANQSCMDTATLQVEIQTTTERPFLNNFSFKLFPNPAHDFLEILATNQTPATSVSIYNFLGETVWNQPLDQLKTKVPVQHLTPGVYQVVIFSKENNYILQKITFLKK